MDMMSTQDLHAHLEALRLPYAEAAELLGVSERSVRRWADGEDVPGPVEAALRAWLGLERRHLPWKPDSISLLWSDEDQLARMRQHDQMLDTVLKQVEDRGGPTNPWAVDIPKCQATFGPSTIWFYRLANGGFSLSNYRRADRRPSAGDQTEIEDATYAIALAFSRARAANQALLALAGHLTKEPRFFVRDGPKLLSDHEIARRERVVAEVASELNQLASGALGGAASYNAVEAAYRRLHAVGTYPPERLVSDIAKSFLGPIKPRREADGAG
jgi:hypothetical protein